jgi:hypothetical protein
MEDNNHLILNLVKQVKSIGYQLAAIESISGPLIREEFNYVGSQSFTTSFPLWTCSMIGNETLRFYFENVLLFP